MDNLDVEEQIFIKGSRATAVIMILATCCGPIFIVARYFNFFSMSYTFSFALTMATSITTFSYLLLIKYVQNKKISQYAGLLFLSVLISLFGIERHIGIAISYGIVPLLSCMYMNKKLTLNITIFNYIMMILSLFFKSFEEYESNMYTGSQMEWFLPLAAGFTMEYAFVFTLSYFIANLLAENFAAIKKRNVTIKRYQAQTIVALANAVEIKEPYTGLHLKNTSRYVKMICNALKGLGYYTHELTPAKIELFEKTAPLHDIGKLAVGEDILKKQGRYTDDEFEKMKIHTIKGYEYIKDNLKEIGDEDFLDVAGDMALCHHEKWDGSGYPNKLQGSAIPLCARIMAAADVLDALLNKRLYKQAWTLEDTIQEFEKQRGKHFEPCIVDAVLVIKDELCKTTA